jgi:sulfur carrier protein ThiS adenylyltransferase
MEGMYARQRSIELDLPAGVAVVGCGGVGSWVAWLLAMTGVPELWLYDHDVVDESNLNRVPYLPEDVGKPKTEALANLIKRYRPDCKVVACGMWIAEVVDMSKLHNEVSWIVAATDTAASRRLIYDWAEAKMVRYIEVGAEGEMGSVTGCPAEFTTPAETQVGYQSVPVWAGPSVQAALMAVAYVCHGFNPGDTALRAGWGPSVDAEKAEDFGAMEYVLFNSDYDYEQQADAEAEGMDDDAGPAVSAGYISGHAALSLAHSFASSCEELLTALSLQGISIQPVNIREAYVALNNVMQNYHDAVAGRNEDEPEATTSEIDVEDIPF